MKARVVPVCDPVVEQRDKLKEGLLFKRFYMAEQDFALRIAKGDIDLSKTEFRVWYALLAHVEKGNYVYHRRAFMAEEIGMLPAHFYTAIRGLYAKDMLAYAPDRGKGKSLMLSPAHTWRGGGAEHRMAMRQYISHRKAK